MHITLPVMQRNSTQQGSPRAAPRGGVTKRSDKAACDRCRRQKLRCIWDTLDSPEPHCQRCQRANTVCTVSAPRPMGRPSRHASTDHRAHPTAPGNNHTFAGVDTDTLALPSSAYQGRDHSTPPELTYDTFDFLDLYVFPLASPPCAQNSAASLIPRPSTAPCLLLGLCH